jgi:pimeloyl-ACP methyl ester carboxylesterase
MAAVTAPTLVVWGGRDRLVNVALAPRVAGTIPDARLLVLPDVGHVAQLEDPVTTARAALGLLEDVRRVERPAGEGVAP